MKKETILMTIGGLIALGVIVGAYLLWRLYKRIGRRCACGEMVSNYHVSKIMLPLGDVFRPRDILVAFSVLKEKKNLAGIKEFRQKLKWWYRSITLVTFSICPVCGKNGKEKVQVVTISHRPVSYWHLFWVWLRKRDQFHDDSKLTQVYYNYLRTSWRTQGRPELENEEGMNPPFKMTAPSIKF